MTDNFDIKAFQDQIAAELLGLGYKPLRTPGNSLHSFDSLFRRDYFRDMAKWSQWLIDIESDAQRWQLWLQHIEQFLVQYHLEDEISLDMERDWLAQVVVKTRELQLKQDDINQRIFQKRNNLINIHNATNNSFKQEIQSVSIPLSEDDRILRYLLILDPSYHAMLIKQSNPKEGEQEREAQKLDKAKKQRLQISEKKAKELLSQKDVLSRLCPVLQTGSGDVFTIANTVAQVLVPLVIAGVLSIPLTPILFASIALLITRMGISVLCADIKGNSQ